MVDVDKLSDAELRTKLIEFGFPALPVTGTTRKVMVKKLKLLMENKSVSNPDGRRSLGRYSSEDDSDNDVKITKNKRRVTMAAPPMQPPRIIRPIPIMKPTVKKTTRIVETTIEEDVPKAGSELNTSTRTSRIVRKAQDEFDTGSESESEIIRNSHKLSPEIESKASKLHKSPIFNSPTSSLVDPMKKSFENSYTKTFTSSSERPTAFSSPFSSDSASDRLNQIRTRINAGSTGIDRVSSYNSPIADAGVSRAKEETPFLSNFTRRLSQMSASRNSEYSNKSDAIKEHDTNGATLYPRTAQYSSIRTTTRPREYQYDHLKSNRNGGNLLKDNLVPFTVLTVAVLFFIFVGFIYLGMRSDTSLEPIGYKVPLCDATIKNHTRGVNCVLEKDVDMAINLFRPLKAELKRRGVEKICVNSSISDRMFDDDVVEFVVKKFDYKDKSKILTDLRNLQVLILKNPSWGITIVQAAPDEEITDKNIVSSLDRLGFERVTKPISLTILNPDVPWSCSIVNKFFLVFKAAVTLMAIFAAVYASKRGYDQYSIYQKNRRNEIIGLVEKILDVLQSGVGTEGDHNYMVINHVRDMIIPVNERRAKEKTWKQAVEFINENESRVRTEIQVVQGEEYFVWRWVGSTNLSLNASKNKSWQGQAFETQMGAVNSLPCSPTPCLKIRGMVEEGDRNTQVIREAVLSKCASKCRILHCTVDNHMKCVYLKCVDTGDAGVAYQNLHGWWYAGQLVTVKYVRLERYMQRFPDSPSSGPPYLKAMNLSSDGWAS